MRPSRWVGRRRRHHRRAGRGDGWSVRRPVYAAARGGAEGARGERTRSRATGRRSTCPAPKVISRLVSLGSVIVDLVLEVPRLPERGGDVLATQRGMAAGGALNVLSAAARLGLPGVYAGPHGTGPFGDRVRAALAREGIEASLPPNPILDTGWTLALIEPDAERSFVTVTGDDALVSAEALRSIAYEDGDAVYVSGYDLAYPGAGAALSEHVAAIGRGQFVVLDPGPLVAEIEA